MGNLFIYNTIIRLTEKNKRATALPVFFIEIEPQVCT